MKKKMKFGQFLFIAILFLACIPLFGMSGLSLSSVYQNSKNNFIDNAKQVTNTAKIIIDNKIVDYSQKLDSLVKVARYDDLNLLRDQLKLLASDDSSILNMYYVDDATGGFYQMLDEQLPEGVVPKELPWYEATLSLPNEYPMEEPYQDSFTGKFVSTIYKAAIKDGHTYGVFGIDIDLTQLSGQLSQLNFGETGEVTIVESLNGAIISDSNTNKLGLTEPTEYSIWNDVLNNELGEFSLVYNNVKYEGIYDTSELTGWKVIAKITKNELTKEVKKQINILVIVMIISLVISTIISLMLIKGVNRAMNNIGKGIIKASKGEFDFDANYKTSTHEFYSMGKNFKDMKDGIQNLISNVNAEADALNTQANRSAEVTEEIANSIEQVSKTITEISTGALEAAEGLENITEHIEYLSTSMDNMKNGSEKVSDMAKETRALSGKGLEMVSEVISKTEETKKSTSDVKLVVEEVSNSIANIKVINETIKGFTEQTNLLALNAAIEAARAGEAGKGFAVVADEIRKLAEETAVSSKQIDDIVREIDKKSEMAVESVESTVTIVESQDNVVNETKRAFTEIISSIEILTDRVYKITEGLGEVNGMKDKVVEEISNLSAILQETAAGTEEVTASAEEVASATEDFVVAFKDIKKMAEVLKENISKFKF